jgi:membrane protein required for colicin V production
MPVTILDLIVIGVILLSALLAMLRGFTREILAIGSWAVAAIVAYLFYPKAAPYVLEILPKASPTLVTSISGGAVFLGTLFLAYIVTSKLSDFILDSRVGALDRTLGFIFGAARGFLLAVVGFGFFTWLVHERQQPSWVSEARFRPILIGAFDHFKTYLPEDFSTALPETLKQSTEPAPPASPPANVPPKP